MSPIAGVGGYPPEEVTERDRAVAFVKKLPPTIRVGVYDFAIEQWDSCTAMGRHRWGECSVSEMHIGIQRDMPSRIKAADTFSHEVMHATYWAFGISDDDKEERTVNLMASGMLCVYRDNPWLLDWLKEAVS